MDNKWFCVKPVKIKKIHIPNKFIKKSRLFFLTAYCILGVLGFIQYIQTKPNIERKKQV